MKRVTSRKWIGQSRSRSLACLALGEGSWLARTMAWLLACLIIGSYFPVRASSTHPYYRRSKPVAQNVDYFSRVRYPIFLTNTNIHLDPYVVGSFNLSAFTNRFDARAAAAV